MSGESSLTNSYIQVSPTQAQGTPAALLNQPVALLGSGLFLCHMGGPLRAIERGRNYNVFFMLRKGLESQQAFAFEALDMPGYFLTITQDDTPELQRFNGTLNHAVACTFDIDNVVTDGPDLLCELYPRKHNSACMNPRCFLRAHPVRQGSSPCTFARMASSPLASPTCSRPLSTIASASRP